jgi:hypothetical protein
MRPCRIWLNVPNNLAYSVIRLPRFLRRKKADMGTTFDPPSSRNQDKIRRKSACHRSQSNTEDKIPKGSANPVIYRGSLSVTKRSSLIDLAASPASRGSSPPPSTASTLDHDDRGNPKQRYSVDCSRANKGLFCGIFVIVVIIISLVVFFVLVNSKDEDVHDLAITVAAVTELSLYSVAVVAVVIGMVQVLCCLLGWDSPIHAINQAIINASGT